MQSKVSYATTWRIVEDIWKLGALRVDIIGSSRRVSLNPNSPLLRDLRQIADVQFAPHRDAARRFAGLASRVHVVRKIILFGSVSRGEETVGSDVDLAVVLDRRTQDALSRLDHLAVQVLDETGMVVVPLATTPRQLARNKPFSRTLASGEVLYERS